MMNTKPLVTYSVFDRVYQNGILRVLRGKPDAGAASLGTIDRTVTTGIPFLPTDVDVKPFSFVYKGEVRLLLAKVVTPVSGTAPSTTWSMAAVPTPPFGPWSVLARDIELQYPAKNAATVATNPRGLVQVGERLLIADYDSQRLYWLGANEINGLADGAEHALSGEPFDLGAAAKLKPEAQAQSIIKIQNSAGTDYVFVLFNITDDTEESGYQPSVLVRLRVDANGSLVYEKKAYVGRNGQEIISIFKAQDDAERYIIVPAIGGKQLGGFTNGVESNIMCIQAFADWTAIPPLTLLTGDASTAGRGDIRNIGAAARVGAGELVYINAGYYNSDGYSGFESHLYRTTVADLLSLGGVTLSEAVDSNKLTEVDTKTVITPSSAGGNYYAIYFWDVLYETGDAADGSKDRVYYFRGTELLVTLAQNYGSDTSPLTTPGPYRLFEVGCGPDDIGGENVDAAELTVETARQAESNVSLKHGAKAVRIAVSADADGK